MLSPVLLSALLGLAGGVGWATGWLLHRRPAGVLLADALQSSCGAALGLEGYTLTGPLADGVGGSIAVALLGAWVSLGAAHATAAILHWLRSRDGSGLT